MALYTREFPARHDSLAPEGTPTLVLMHFLGGSGREWDEVAALVDGAMPMITLDMPGFGGSASIPGYTVAQMADSVEDTIRALGLKRFILVGHSMSGKVSAVIARREQDRAARGRRIGLAGMVLVAPSPAGPEPMTEEKRATMIASLGAHHPDEFARARSYITKNEMRDIPRPVELRAAAEVLKMNRTAWVAWVERGSREDWSEYVGILDTPTLVVAGDKDMSLGPDQMRRVVLPHLGRGRLCVVRGCSHLVPMERPEEMARLLKEFVEGLSMFDEIAAHPPAEPAFESGRQRTVVPEEYVSFIASERLSERTRDVIVARMEPPRHADGLLTPDQEETLRAMLARVVPQRGESTVDLTGTIMRRLATGKGDGWRYEILPADLDAYRQGLDRLTAAGFAALDPDAQDKALTALAATPGSADARWFEDVRSDATEAWIAHPATLARIGYSGLGVGGAYTRYKGFVSLIPNGREEWEPEPSLPEKFPPTGIHSADLGAALTIQHEDAR